MLPRKRKPRENASRLATWLDSIFGPLHLEFVAPMSLESAVSLLKQDSQVKAQLKPIDDNTFSLHIKKFGYLFPLSHARGVLHRRSENTTLVSAQVNAPIGIYLAVMIPVIALWMLGIVVTVMQWRSGYNGVDFVIIVWPFIFIAIYWLSVRGESRNLARTIELVLRARRVRSF